MYAFLRRLNRPVIAVIAVTAIAGGLRLYHLSTPAERIFDEHFYSKDGCMYAGYSPPECGIHGDTEKYWVGIWGESSWEHPQLGKWAVALGVMAFGNTPFGWRFPAAVAGTAGVALTAIIAQLLFRKPLWTFVAGLLLAVEGLDFVQSRTAMLDIFLTFWILLAFLFLLLDRRWIERRTGPPPSVPGPEPDRVDVPEPVSADVSSGFITPSIAPGSVAPESVAAEPQPLRPEGAVATVVETASPEPPPSPIFRPWRLAMAVALGCAIATKWSGVNAILAAGLISLLWERTRRKGTTRRPLWKAIQQESFGLVLFLVLVPIVVYVVAYARFWVQNGFDLSHFWNLQESMASFHFHLQGIDPKTGKPIHPYLSPAWKWIFIGRPVVYYFTGPGREVTDLGNPAIFWGSLIALPYVAIQWWRRRDLVAGFVIVAGLGQYLPWFLVSRPQFFFYVLPIVPFFVLALTYMARDLATVHLAGSRARPYLPVAVAFVITALAAFVFFYPVLAAVPLSEKAWQARQWFGSWI
ncbi:MAG TPA: phospholipid carrier-dependent glycosyltransferase [Actinomycetota bacterium]